MCENKINTRKIICDLQNTKIYFICKARKGSNAAPSVHFDDQARPSAKRMPQSRMTPQIAPEEEYETRGYDPNVNNIECFYFCTHNLIVLVCKCKIQQPFCFFRYCF